MKENYYKKFLSNTGVISEEKFNDILNSIAPILDLETFGAGDFDITDDEDGIARSLFDLYLGDYDWVYIDNISYNLKTIELYDVKSLEDLENIKSDFDSIGWTLNNYDELKETLEEEEKEEFGERADLVYKIQSLPIEKLKEIVEKYV